MHSARHTPLFALAALAAVTLFVASAPVSAAGRSNPADGTELTVDALKSAYLDCERAAISGSLDTGGIIGCSILYEELKRRVFDGDFRALKRWFDDQPGWRPEPGDVAASIPLKVGAA